MQHAWKVGLFVVVFVGLILGAYALLQKSFFTKPTDTYFADFRDAGGVSTGSTVLMSGVKVGQVTKVELLSADKARLTLALDKGTQIPQNSTAFIPASFISIGDIRIQILPSSSHDTLMPGATLPGRLGSPLESFAPESGATLTEINKTLQSLQGLLADQGLKKQLSELMTSVNDTTKKFGNVAGRIDGLVAANSSKFGDLLTTTGDMLKNMQAVSVEIKDLVASGQLQDKTTALLDNLNDAVKQGKSLVSDMQGLVNDPDMRASLKETMSNVKVMSDSGTKIAANAEVMSKNGIEISEQTKSLMAKANKVADQVQDLIDKFNKTVDRIGNQGKNILDGVEFEGNFAQETRPDRLRTDANIFLPVGKEKVMFGLYDAFESNKLNLQMLRPVNDKLGLRYGVYASKPGIGVDYNFASRLGLRADFFGLNETRLDMRLNYRLAPGVFGWAGVDQLFDRNTASVGVTVRK